MNFPKKIAPHFFNPGLPGLINMYTSGTEAQALTKTIKPVDMYNLCVVRWYACGLTQCHSELLVKRKEYISTLALVFLVLEEGGSGGGSGRRGQEEGGG